MSRCSYDRSYDWDISGSLAVGTGRECGMVIFDISNPGDPEAIKFYDANLDIASVVEKSSVSLEDAGIKNTHVLFAAHQDGLVIYDISEPGSPQYVSRVPTSNAWSLAQGKNDLIYIADGQAGLTIVDISDRANPQILSTAPAGGAARHIKIKDRFAFLAVGGQGVDVLDISDPEKPKMMDNFATGGFNARIDVQGDLIAAAVWDRVQVLQ